MGQAFEIEQNLVLTPQAQLSWSQTDFGTFWGPSNERVSHDSSETMVLRVGMSADKSREFGNGDRQMLYSNFDILHDFEGGSLIDISGTQIANQPEDWNVRLGLGARYTWVNNTSAFGEFSYTTGTDNIGSNRTLQLSAGARLDF